jgi:hypothetical protein
MIEEPPWRIVTMNAKGAIADAKIQLKHCLFLNHANQGRFMVVIMEYHESLTRPDSTTIGKKMIARDKVTPARNPQ